MIPTPTGNFRHRLTIQQVGETRDSFGGVVSTWGTFATVWGSVEPLRGRELIAAQERQAKIDVRIRIRYLRGVTAKMRVVFGTHTYEIVSVINPEMLNIELQLMCWELTGT